MSKNDRQRIIDAGKRLNNDIPRIAKNLALPQGQIRAVLGIDAPARAAAAPKPSKSKPKIRVRSLAEFESAHDYPAILREAIKTHLSDGYLTESELRSLLTEKVPARFWRETADADEFDNCHFRHGEKTLWSAPNNIRAMKRAIGLAT
jgi:hypothetical protein